MTEVLAVKMDFVKLIKTGAGWQFATEVELENFVWKNLKHLLGLTLLKRQHYVSSQFCDILALGENKQLFESYRKNRRIKFYQCKQPHA